MARLDWLVAIDDLLVERFRRCTACGAGATGLGIVEIAGRGYSYGQCASCKRTDPQGARVQVLLVARVEAIRPDVGQDLLLQ